MNNTQIPIDELYDQLTLILQEEKYAKSTIQLYQEHVKRIKKFMLANNITDYSSSVADQYYKKMPTASQLPRPSILRGKGLLSLLLCFIIIL